MGLFEKVAKVVMVFQADTSDLEKKVKKLSGQEKEFTQNYLNGIKQRNSALDQWSQRLANANQILELGTKAIQFATDAWQEYEKAAVKAGGAQADKAREMRGAINAWNESMRNAKVAIGEMTTALAPFIRQLAAAVNHIGQLSQYANFSTDPRTGAWLADPGGSAANALGFGRGLVGDSTTAALNVWWSQVNPATGRLRSEEAKDRARLDAERAPWERNEAALALDAWETGFLGGFGVPAGFKPSERGRGGRYTPSKNPMLSAAFGGAQPGGISGVGASIYQGAGAYGINFDQGLGGMAGGLGSVGASRGLQASYTDTASTDLERMRLALQQSREDAAAFQSERRESILESVFGPLDEFDAYAEKMQLLGDAVGIFGGALQSGFDAWVSGSLTAAQAIKQAFAQTIQGIASSLFAHAIEHGAAAVGNLAWGNLAGAALHGKAAAGYAAGAVAVGGIARALGGNANSAGAGAGGGAPVAGYGGGSGGGGTVTNIYVSDSASGADGARFRRQRIERDAQLARRTMDDEAVRWS